MTVDEKLRDAGITVYSLGVLGLRMGVHCYSIPRPSPPPQKVKNKEKALHFRSI